MDEDEQKEFEQFEREYEDVVRLSKQEITPDDFLAFHPEARGDYHAWKYLAFLYNKGGRKKFSWRKAKHDFYKEFNN